MRALERALRCLAHPTSLLAIGLLLLNDHFLKEATPSWWTGKLSDFAGLYFFPFILAALLGLVTNDRWPVRRTGGAAMAIVGLWFALMKTAPAVNEATTIVWGRLTGGPVAIALDPSDLLALTVLWPAWRLWQHELGSRSVPGLNWLGFLGLSIGALASLATSCDAVVLPIERVLYWQGEWFAASYYYTRGPEYFHFDMERGTWGRPIGMSELPPQDLATPAALPVESCLEDGLCYRVQGDERVLVSDDGGASWTVAWQLPPGRRLFLGRFPSSFCKGPVDLGPYDVAVTGTREVHRVVVAMGNQGVLMRHPDGQWEQQAVELAEPTPLAVQEGWQFVAVLPVETVILTVLTLFVGVLLYQIVWRIRPLVAIQLVILVPLTLALLVYVWLSWVTFVEGESLTSCGVLLLLLGLPLGIILAHWKRRAEKESIPKDALRWWLVAILAPLTGYLFLVLWAIGAIARYEMALAAGLLVSITLLALSSRKMWRLVRRQHDS